KEHDGGAQHLGDNVLRPGSHVVERPYHQTEPEGQPIGDKPAEHDGGYGSHSALHSSLIGSSAPDWAPCAHRLVAYRGMECPSKHFSAAFPAIQGTRFQDFLPTRIETRAGALYV